MTRLAFVLALLLGLASAAPAQDRAEVQALADEFAAAVNAGDAAAIAEMYLDDAVILPPGSEMIRGREAIRSFWAGAVKGVRDTRLTAVDVQPLGEQAAREIGSFTFTMDEGQQPQLTGKYVVVWHRQGDAWKIGTDIWNMNQ